MLHACGLRTRGDGRWKASVEVRAAPSLGISAMPKLRTPMPQTLQRSGLETTGHRRRPYPCRKRVIATLIGGPPTRPTSYDFAQRETERIEASVPWNPARNRL